MASVAAAVVQSADVSSTPDPQASGGARRSWRITRPTVGTIAVLVGIVIGALALRFVGLGWGRPFVYHPDEWVVADPAMNMVRSGSWNPGLFTYPSGLIYIERFIISGLHLLNPSVSLATDTMGGYAGLPWRAASDGLPEQFNYFYAGRAVVAVVGALMAVPTYFAARSVSNAVGGVAAAVAIAVAPLAVLNSQYLTTDVPTAALTALTLCLSLRGLAGGRRWLVAAGFAAGLAASTKYNGGLVVIVPLVVLLTSCPPRQLLRRPAVTTAGLIILASIAGFVLLTPAVVFDPAHVWSGGILFQFRQYTGGHPGAEGSDNAVYFLRVLWGGGGLGPGLAILAALGLLIAVVQRRRADLAVLSFVVAYYVLISLPPVRFDRNLIPLMPFLAVLAGRAVGWLVDFLTSHRPQLTIHSLQLTAHLRPIPSIAIGLAIVAVAATPSFSAAVASDQMLRQTDTRTIALQWIEQNVPRGATIAREEYTPQIPNSEYKVGFVWLLANKPLEWYRAAGFDYVVTSGFQFDRYVGIEPQDAFYRSLLAEPIVLDLRPQPGQPGPRVVVVRLHAAAVATLVVSGILNPYPAGTTHSVKVAAEDAYGNVVRGYLGTVHFGSTDARAVLPADYTFTAADAGVHKFSNALSPALVLRTAGTQSVRATDTAASGITGVLTGIVVTPAAATHLTVSGILSPFPAGSTHGVTVTAKDAYGNFATGYRGTIHFTSTDPAAVLPPDYTFTAADAGTHTFGVTLNSLGPQAVRARDTVKSTITGSESGSVVN